MSETDISTAAVEAHAKRLRYYGHSGKGGILPVTLALLADRDRLQRENDNLRQIERNVQAVREHEHQRANAAEADRDRLAAEVARLREARVALIASDRGVCIGGRWDGWLMVRHPDGHWVSHHKLENVDPASEMTDLLRAAHAARREGEA